MQWIIATTVSRIATFALQVPSALLVLIAGWFVIKILVRVLGKALQVAKIEPTMATLFKAALSLMAWVIVIAAALQALGLNEVALAVSGSIALIVLAVATSASGISGDVIAGVFLVGDEDFKAGYTINVAGVEGVIRSVDLRKTRIDGADGKRYVIPNKTVESATWVVESRGE